MISLATPVANMGMVGPVYASRLKKLGILSIKDLLFHVPNRYENFNIVSKIANLQEGETVTVFAHVDKFENVFTKTGKKFQKLTVSDETGKLLVLFFNQAFLKNIFIPGVKVALTGIVKIYQNNLSFIAPGYELVKQDSPLYHSGRFVPIYPETEGVTSKWLRTRIGALLFKLNIDVRETFPAGILAKHNLLNLKDAVYKVHFPETLKEAELAMKRLSFNELTLHHLASIIRKKKLAQVRNNFVIDKIRHQTALSEFIKTLPFNLTSSQITAIQEIQADLESSKPMNRLLQGDVGSGKTIVAVIASFHAFLNGYRTLLMAPTEILALQHFETFKKFLAPFNLKIALLTSGSKIQSQDFDIFIGTHALLYGKFAAEKIALVIIDEQQRFGVEQRANLKSISAKNPHLLTMTATPIPRTIALTLYSDLNMSVIEELPQGRLPVKTFIVPQAKRTDAYNWIRKEIKSIDSHKKAFIICPFIENSESLTTVKSAKAEFEKLKSDIFPDIQIDLLHGKLKSSQKEKVLQEFKNGNTKILVATPVVEVGIDIKEATIILIEAADRFGLSQLHQLRGRVGRGEMQSYCLLFTESNSEKTARRLKIMERNNIGIKIAEQDLKLRGPGEFFGTRQHGNFNLKFSDFSDLQNIEIARNAAQELYGADPSLKSFPHLQQELLPYTIPNITLD